MLETQVVTTPISPLFECYTVEFVCPPVPPMFTSGLAAVAPSSLEPRWFQECSWPKPLFVRITGGLWITVHVSSLASSTIPMPLSMSRPRLAMRPKGTAEDERHVEVSGQPTQASPQTVH